MTPDSDSGYLPPLRAGILEPIRQILEYEQFGYLSLLRGENLSLSCYKNVSNLMQRRAQVTSRPFCTMLSTT